MKLKLNYYVFLNLLIFFTPISIAEKYDGETIEEKKLKVGIIGAGISGLTSALMLQTLNIDYEILEANERTGGRFFTYCFDHKEKECFDMGAMRFPKHQPYDRITGSQNWSLLNYINNHVDKKHQLKRVPFVMNNDNLIDYFNGKKVLRKHSATDGDWFGFGVENGGYLPQKFAEKPPLHWVNKSLEKIKKEFAVSKHNGYRYLLKHDNQSFLEYCSKEPHLFYPPEVVDWVQLRTAKLGLDTRGFVDHYFYENFLTSEFFTIEGGLTKIIKALESLLKAKAKLRHRVIAIKFLGFERKLEIVTNRGRKFYDYVILTPTLKAIQSIDMKSLHLSLKKRVAFEVINYLDGIKIALQFKSRFWENEKTMNGKPIFGGQAFTDLPATTIVFPSTHLGCTDCRGVLLATYTHDRRTKEFDFLSDSDKVKLALKNMREIFGDIVIEQYTGNYYVKSWQNDELFRAISPYFDAGQFSSYYRELRKPEMNGRLHFANDIAIPHGSSSGSVNAAYFAIEGILKNENLSKKLNEFRSKWGVEREFI